MTANYNLDHVVLLLPYDYLDNPPDWITQNFTLSPGGRHGDGKTENRLILFRDGTYLELIAFVNDNPKHREGHWWDKPCGVIDYALGGPDLNYDSLIQRLERTDTGITYVPPKLGGRTRPDGVKLKWEVTFPKGVERGYVPFFCTDVTPREHRVPITQENTTHPSGVLGMAGMLVEVSKEKLDRLSTATAAALGSEKQASNEYETRLPDQMDKMRSPTIRLHECSAESDKDLALTLVLQTEKQEGMEDVREKIGGGVVAIDFERVGQDKSSL